MQTGSALVLAILLAPSAAHAGDARTVALHVDPCLDADRAQLDRLVALELAAAIPGAELGSAGAAALRLACDGERVTIAWRGGRGGIDRVIDPGPATGRERTIALAAVELAVAGWFEHDDRPAAVDDDARPAAVDVDAQSAESPAAWHTTISGGATFLISGDVAAPGASVRIARERDEARWGWAVELGAMRARDSVALGAIELDATSGAAAVHAGWRAGAMTLRGGAGARVTAARFRGVATMDVTAGTIDGIAGGPLATLGAEACSGALCVDAGGEAGWHLAAVRATIDGDRARSLDGAWWLARAGIGVRW